MSQCTVVSDKKDGCKDEQGWGKEGRAIVIANIVWREEDQWVGPIIWVPKDPLEGSLIMHFLH